MKRGIIVLMICLLGNICYAQKINKPTLVKKGNVTEATFYHDNGSVAQTGFYNKQGKLHGEWAAYDVKGMKTTVGNYLNGEKVGVWMFYTDNQIKEVSYSNSKISKVKTLEVTDVHVASNKK